MRQPLLIEPHGFQRRSWRVRKCGLCVIRKGAHPYSMVAWAWPISLVEGKVVLNSEGIKSVKG